MLRWLPLLWLPLLQDPDIDALLKLLADESIAAREKAAAALVGLGDKAEARLKKEVAAAQGELKAKLEEVVRAIDKQRRLRAVLPVVRLVSLEAKDRPVKEVLEELKSKSGLPLDPSQVGNSSISVSVKEACPLEALDAVCRAADLEFLPEGELGWHDVDEPTKPAMRLRPGHSKSPRAFSGHFMISTSEIRLTQSLRFEEGGDPPPAGIVTLNLAWHPAAVPALIGSPVIRSVRDDKGNDLREKLENDRFDGYYSPRRDIPKSLDVEIQKPGAGATKIASLAGTIIILVETGATKVAFDNPLEAKGQTREYDGLTIKLVECVQSAGNLKIRVSISGKRKSKPKEEGDERSYGPSADNIEVKSEDGNLGEYGYSWSRGGEASTLTLHGFRSKPTSIIITVDREFHEEKFDFELKDIPLPK